MVVVGGAVEVVVDVVVGVVELVVVDVVGFVVELVVVDVVVGCVLVVEEVVVEEVELEVEVSLPLSEASATRAMISPITIAATSPIATFWPVDIGGLSTGPPGPPVPPPAGGCCWS